MTRLKRFIEIREKGFKARMAGDIPSAIIHEQKADLLYQKMNDWDKRAAEDAENALLEDYVYGDGR